MKLAILGAGNMGMAFAQGLLTHAKDFELILSDRIEKHEKLRELEVMVTSNNTNAVKNADVVLLAVKPQDMLELCREIAPHLSEKILVISIAAGMKIFTLSKALASERVVRVMPNLPATIGKSMSGWFAAPSLTSEDKKVVRKILQSIGSELEVSCEDMIDQITAMSGSGPAYVWKMMECMIQAGVKIGLSEEQSRQLTSQTFFGASTLANLRPEGISFLRERVTSKGGTTEMALHVFDEREIGKIFEDAVRAAYERAKELGS